MTSLRDFQDDKCDIIGLYDENQVRKLKELNEIPSNINLNEDNEFTGLDDEDPFAVGSSSKPVNSLSSFKLIFEDTLKFFNFSDTYHLENLLKYKNSTACIGSLFLMKLPHKYQDVASLVLLGIFLSFFFSMKNIGPINLLHLYFSTFDDVLYLN